MRVVQASRWEWTVAGLGLVLLLLLFSEWYDVELMPRRVYEYKETGGFGGDPVLGVTESIGGELSGWATGTVTSIVVLLFSAACIAQALVLRAVRSPAVGAAWNVAVEWAAIVIVLWIAARAIWTPDALLAPAWGLWASLGVAIAILVVNWLGMRDERDDPALAPPVPVRPIPPLPR